MADFRGYVTAAGQTFEALAKQMGYPVTIGFIEVGDGKLPDSESPIDRTQLVHKLKQFPAIVEQDAKNPGQWVATCYIPADDAIDGAGYFIREIGCKLINQGNGVLYAYRRVSDDWKPVLTSGEAKSFIYKLRFIPSNGELLTPTIDPSVVLVDKEELARVMAKHVESRDHPEATDEEIGFSRHATQSELDENLISGKKAVVTTEKMWSFIRRVLSPLIYRDGVFSLRDIVSVKDFGAKGDGKTDDTDAIERACLKLQELFEVDGQRRTLHFPDGVYRTSRTFIVHKNMCISCSHKLVFQNIGASKSFHCLEIHGGAKKSTLGVMDGYLSGFILRGSTHNVFFQTISNCIDGFSIRADKNWLATKSNLDNKVTGIQIGRCINAIVFEQNEDKLVQQGNEIRINFVSETPNTLVFRTFDDFEHTSQSNWDSNLVELMASDPARLANSSMARNMTNYGVPNITFSIMSWCGGWTPDAGTICLIRGPFSTSTFTFSLAERVGLAELVDDAGVNSFGSCILNLPRYENLGTASAYYQAVTPGASFNGGVALVRGKFRVRATVPDLAPGQTYGLSFWHVLVQRSGTSRVRIDQYSDFARGKYLIELRDAGTETKGMVRVWITNIKSTTVTGGDIDLTISTC